MNKNVTHLVLTAGPELLRFDTFGQWKNNAQDLFASLGVDFCDLVCLDMQGRICNTGSEMARAHRTDAFPVVVYHITPNWEKPKRKTVHLSMNIRSILDRTEEEFNEDFDGLFSDDDGNQMSQAQVRAELEKELANGVEKLRCGSECKTFDPKTGCQGCEE